jgi:hypothetical protein
MSAPARYLVALTHNLHVRNFLASGCLDELTGRGHELHLLVPGALRAAIGAPTAVRRALAVEPLEPYLGGRLRNFLRRRWRVGSFAARRHLKTYRHKIRLASGSPSFALQLRAFSLLGRFGDVETMWQRWEDRLAPRRSALALVRRVAPDVLFTPTLIHDGAEIELVKAARRLGVPSVGFASSWDTLTSKGAFAVRPGYLLVWGAENRRHAVAYHGFDEGRVIATGAPHLDVYADGFEAEPRPEFLARRGVPPDRRVLLFAGTTVTYWEDEPRLLRALSEAIEDGRLKDCVIWYRPHPRRPPRDLPDVRSLPHVVMDDQARRQKAEGISSYSMRPEDLRHYRSLMDAVDGVVTAFSTMIVEAALRGKPSLVIGFGVDHTNTGRLIQHAEYEHSLHLLSTPGVVLCRSLEELLREAQRVCAGEYAELHDALRARADAIARNRDGRARERIVDALERIAAEHRRARA